MRYDKIVLFKKTFKEDNNNMINGVTLGNIMVDCVDEQALCDFYHKLLGWEKGMKYGLPSVSKDGIVFLFIGEPGYVPPVWPEEEGKQQKQMHFDFQVPDIHAAAEYAITLGAVKTSLQFGGEEWITLLDPAGHPFCLCAEGNEE